MYRIIAIDCDDVIVPSAEAILDYYNQTYGTHIVLADFTSKDQAVWGVPYAVAEERVKSYLETEAYHQLPPFAEAIHIIKGLSSHYELHMVTARHDALAAGTEAMLARHLPNVFTSIEFTNFHIGPARSKAQVCQDLGADLLIDDHLSHVTAAAECGIDTFLFGDYPWNQLSPLPPGITRVRNWQEVKSRLLLWSAAAGVQK